MKKISTWNVSFEMCSIVPQQCFKKAFVSKVVGSAVFRPQKEKKDHFQNVCNMNEINENSNQETALNEVK